MPGESLAVPTDDGVGLNHLETSPPTGPELVQHNPQEPVAAVEAQATRRVLLKDRKLVTKREDLRLEGSTGSKSGGYQSEKGDEKRAHGGSRHDLTNDQNLCVFRSDGVFGSHRWQAYRRGLATNLKKLGVPDTTIQAILRHESVSTTQRFYIKTAREDAMDAMKRLEEKLKCAAVVQQKVN
jgi:hypothetical protein